MDNDRESKGDDALNLVPETDDESRAPGVSGTEDDGESRFRGPRLTELPRDTVAPGDHLSQFISRTTGTAVEEVEESPEESLLPRQPKTLLDLGLSKAFLTDLTLKIIHYSGSPSTAQLTRRLGLGQHIVQHLVTALTEDRLIEVLSQSDLYTGNYRYRLSERGHTRVNEALERSRYAGPAPVTAEQYTEVLRRLFAQRTDPGRGRIKNILNDMTLAPETADAIARALFSGKSGILYGPSGNGKTVILERFAREMEGVALVPYAIYAYGQVIRVFDQSIHESVDQLDGANVGKDDAKVDRRWVLTRRPAVILGAEIGAETLDVSYDPQSRFYQAPPHIKAQGGVLIVDDFGRAKVPAKDLLTRWLIPLERGWDTLTLVTGEKVTVPFNMQLFFGTNLKIKDLADDALLRRILYKVHVPNPRPQDFSEILRQLCRQRRVLVKDGALEYVVEKLFSQTDVKPRASHARDILDMVIESASYDGRDPVLDRETVDRALSLFLAPENGERFDEQIVDDDV